MKALLECFLLILSISTVRASPLIEFIDAIYDENGLRAEVPCISKPACGDRNSPTRLTFGELNPFTVVSNRFKILMEYTPKSDCTVAVAMFLEQMGFRYGKEYRGWPQFFQEKYYDKYCGKVHPCMYTDNTWFRFKVTRNPYDRVVSSYLYILQNRPLAEKAIPADKRDVMTFSEFVDHLLTLSEEEMEYYGDGHGGYQSKSYERAYYLDYLQQEASDAQTDASIMKKKKMSLFDEILKIEESSVILKRINHHFNMTFHMDYLPPHYAVRRIRSHTFVGDIPYQQLRDGIPRNYALFYNAEIKEKVQKRFHWDLLLYNYSFPFHLLPST